MLIYLSIYLSIPGFHKSINKLLSKTGQLMPMFNGEAESCGLLGKIYTLYLQEVDIWWESPENK